MTQPPKGIRVSSRERTEAPPLIRRVCKPLRHGATTVVHVNTAHKCMKHFLIQKYFSIMQ